MKRNRSFAHAESNHRGAAVFNGPPPPLEEGAALATRDASAHDAVELGSTVHICDLYTEEREEYTLVPPDHADILHHRISSLSPVGSALFGRRVGEVVEVDAPSGTIALRIEHIRHSA
jgi:transcription elongation factor GreA